MRYALYEKASGNIISIVQSTDRPQEFDADLGYADFPDDAEQSLYHVVNGVAVQKDAAVIEQQEIDRGWTMLRRKRDVILARCDWTQAPDAPVDQAAWAVYRQQLRDLPSNTTDPRNPAWPSPPA
jgi:hypothetical protein